MTDAEGSWKASNETRTLYIWDASSLQDRSDLYCKLHWIDFLPGWRYDDGANIMLFDRLL